MTAPVAVVTGGGRGIGLATTRALLDHGYRVAAGDDRIDALAALAGAHPETVLAHQCDLSLPGAPEGLVHSAANHFGRLDVLVNNVADFPDAAGFTELDDAHWGQSLAINLMSHVRASRAAIPHLREAGGGAMVHVGSDAGAMPHPDHISYSVTKAAMVSLSKAISKSFGRDGIRSNLVAPGLTRTHATEALLGSLAREHGSEDQGVAAFAGQVGMALPRVGSAEEVAALIVFLAGPAAAQITGAEVRIDGGVVPSL